jgi:hypothetical protein
MKNKLSIFILLTTIAYSLSACAQTKKAITAVKSGASFASVVQTINSKDENGNSAPHIIIKWKASQAPETFFWRGDDGWATSEILSAKKVKGKNTYTTSGVAIDKIKKNTILQVTPVYGGKYATPSEIPENAKNTLFFKTAKTGWLSLPVKDVK